MNQSNEITIKKIRQSKSSSEIETLIDKELLKSAKSKADIATISKFLKELKSDLLKINAIDVNSNEWDNIKKARLHLNSTISSSTNLKPIKKDRPYV